MTFVSIEWGISLIYIYRYKDFNNSIIGLIFVSYFHNPALEVIFTCFQVIEFYIVVLIFADLINFPEAVLLTYWINIQPHKRFVLVFCEHFLQKIIFNSGMGNFVSKQTLELRIFLMSSWGKTFDLTRRLLLIHGQIFSCVV